jgi:hypothetical protein
MKKEKKKFWLGRKKNFGWGEKKIFFASKEGRTDDLKAFVDLWKLPMEISTEMSSFSS